MLHPFPSNYTYGVPHILLKMVVTIFKNEKDDPRNYRPVNLALVPSKIMEKVVLEGMEKYLKDYEVLSQPPWLHKGKVLLVKSDFPL